MHTVGRQNGRKDFGRGFTLLEIVIVLVISTMILGGAAAVMTFSSEEYALKKAARELEALAKRARVTSMLRQTPYALEFTPGMVRLMPWAEALGEERIEMAGAGEDGARQATDPVRWELSLDNGMQSRVRRWNSREWIELGKGQRQLWRFDPTGLSEPIAVELSLEGGWIGMEFNPLTAAISESHYQAR